MKYPVILRAGARIVRDPNMTIRMVRDPNFGVSTAGQTPTPVPPVTPGLPYLDTFGGSGSLVGRVSGSGHTYPDALIPNTVIADGRLRMAADDAFTLFSIAPTPGTPDYYVRLVVLSEGWGLFESNQVFIRLRASGFPQNFYQALITAPGSGGGGVLAWSIATADGDLDSGTASTDDADDGDPFDFEFSVEGSTIKLIIGETIYSEITNADVTDAGRIYLGMELGGDAGAKDQMAILNAQAGAL